jgi:hypothetical protein
MTIVHELKEYIDQKFRLQNLNLMNFHIQGKIAQLQILENFSMLESHDILDGNSKVKAQALRAEIEALKKFRDQTQSVY